MGLPIALVAPMGDRLWFALSVRFEVRSDSLIFFSAGVFSI